MKNLIDKSRMNATEKSDKFKSSQRTKEKRKFSQFNFKIKSAENYIIRKLIN